MTAWFGPNGTVVHYYVRRGELVNWIAHFEADWRDESWSVESDWREAAAAYAGWHPTLAELFSRTERCYKWALYDRDPLPRWTQGRVTLLGDAAHPMLPYLAQGAAQAIEDGYVLADMLDAAPQRSARGARGLRSGAAAAHVAHPAARPRARQDQQHDLAVRALQARPRLPAQAADQAEGAHLQDRMDLRPRRDGAGRGNGDVSRGRVVRRCRMSVRAPSGANRSSTAKIAAGSAPGRANTS